MLVRRWQANRAGITTMQPAFKPTLYQQLEALPEGLTGEILDGQYSEDRK